MEVDISGVYGVQEVSYAYTSNFRQDLLVAVDEDFFIN
jgi:hypothetical protein